jgi:hypothetical protein
VINFIKILCIVIALATASLATLMWLSIRQTYACGNDNVFVKDDIESIDSVRKYVLERSIEYQDAITASNFIVNPSTRNSEELGWSFTRRIEDTSPFSSVNVIDVIFSGRNGSRITCTLLHCGKVIGYQVSR